MAAIPPSLEEAILEQAGKGLTSRQIETWLKDTHGVETTYKSVQRLLSRTRGERAEVAKVVLRDKLGKSLVKDVDCLSKWVTRLDLVCDGVYDAIEKGAEFARAGREGPIMVEGRETLARVVEQLRKVIDTKLRYSGAGEPDEGTQRGPVIYIPPESDD